MKLSTRRLSSSDHRKGSNLPSPGTASKIKPFNPLTSLAYDAMPAIVAHVGSRRVRRYDGIDRYSS